jgi:hypothetical protein
MSASERVYAVLLRAYPAAFRKAFGREMANSFRDLCREADGATVGFWLFVLGDLLRSAPALQLEEVRVTTGNLITEGKMKTMAILALIVGALEALNSAAEGIVGGVVLHGGSALVSGGLGTIAGVLLVASAIAMLRRSRNASAIAQGSAVACLAIFASVTLISPRFSVLATILGICFPVALLAYFRTTGGRRDSVPRAA